MVRVLNHELFSVKKMSRVSWSTLAAAAAAVLVAALVGNWDRLTKTDEDRFREALAAGDFETAIELAETIVASSPGSAAAHLEVASVYVQKAARRQDVAESLVAARRSALRASEIDAASPDAWRAVGYTYELGGDLKLAIEYYQKALDVSPKNVAALTQMGLALVAQGKVSAGERYLGLAVQADPTDPWARIFLARAWLSLANRDAATIEKNLEPALASALSPAVAEAKAIVSSLRLAAGRPEEAELLAREAIAVAPASVEAHIALGEALYDSVFSRQLPWEETFAEVRALGDRLVELDPTRAAGPYLSLRAAARLGDKVSAAAYAERALGALAQDSTLTAAERSDMRAKIRAAYSR